MSHITSEFESCRVCEGLGGDCDQCGGSGGGVRTFQVCDHCDVELEFCGICGTESCDCGGCGCPEDE